MCEFAGVGCTGLPLERDCRLETFRKAHGCKAWPVRVGSASTRWSRKTKAKNKGSISDQCSALQPPCNSLKAAGVRVRVFYGFSSDSPGAQASTRAKLGAPQFFFPSRPPDYPGMTDAWAFCPSVQDRDQNRSRTRPIRFFRVFRAQVCEFAGVASSRRPPPSRQPIQQASLCPSSRPRTFSLARAMPNRSASSPSSAGPWLDGSRKRRGAVHAGLALLATKRSSSSGVNLVRRR